MLNDWSDRSRIPVAFAGVVLVSGAALEPWDPACIDSLLVSRSVALRRSLTSMEMEMELGELA